jgi:hypothetical protein
MVFFSHVFVSGEGEGYTTTTEEIGNVAGLFSHG